MKHNKKEINEAFKEVEKFVQSINESKSQLDNTSIRTQIKEALEDEIKFDEEDEDEDVDTELDLDVEDEVEGDEDLDLDAEDDLDLDLDSDEDDTELDLDLDSDVEGDIEVEDSLLGGDEDILDLTGASDDEVIKVFKKLKDEDEINIVDDGVEITDPESGNEYKVELDNEDTLADDAELDLDLDDSDLDLDTDLDLDVEDDEEGEDLDLDLDTEEDTEEDSEEDEEDLDLDLDSDEEEEDEEEETEEEETEEDEEYVFEVELDENDLLDEGQDDTDLDVLTDEKLDEQIPVGKAQARHTSATDAIRADIVGAGAETELKNLKEAFAKLKKENSNLIAENKAQVGALEMFKTHIVEAKLHLNNLSSISKILLEHSTTKAEKLEIVESISNAKSDEERRLIESNLISKLSNKVSITESVETKVVKANVTTKTAINEAVFNDPNILRARELMGYKNKI